MGVQGFGRAFRLFPSDGLNLFQGFPVFPEPCALSAFAKGEAGDGHVCTLKGLSQWGGDGVAV